MSVADVISLLGGIALFLFGMSLMGEGLKKVAGSRLELVLYKLSSTPLKGVLLGTGVTAVIQSSSATSVMVVGFVNSGMMKVNQAIGIVMGAIPVLCFLYPIVIALSLLHLCGFTGNKRVFRCTMWIVTVASVFEGLKAAHVEIPASVHQTLSIIPLYADGFGWLTIAIFGAVVGVLYDTYKKRHEQKENAS